MFFETGIDGIVPHVMTVVKPILVGKHMAQLGVEIVEIVSGRHTAEAFIGGGGNFDEGLYQNIGIGTPQRYIECRLTFDDGPFQVEAGGDQANGNITVVGLVVTIVHADIYNG